MNVESELACNHDFNDSGAKVHNSQVLSCFLTVNSTVAARDYVLMQIDYQNASKVDIREIKVGDSLSKHGNLNLTFLGQSDQSSLQFSYSDQNTESSEVLTVSLKYWTSFIENYFWQDVQNSGAYIFRPETGQYVPRSYSAFTNGTASG